MFTVYCMRTPRTQFQPTVTYKSPPVPVAFSTNSAHPSFHNAERENPRRECRRQSDVYRYSSQDDMVQDIVDVLPVNTPKPWVHLIVGDLVEPFPSL